CGLGLPSLVAAAKGATVTATDWSAAAIELVRTNAARNGLTLTAEVRDWRASWDERFDLVLAADVLYERRNVEPVLARLRELAPEALVALAGRPYEREFVEHAAASGKRVEQVGKLVRLREER